MKIPEDMESVLPDRMTEIGSKVLVLFGKLTEEYDGEYLAGLSRKNGDNDKFIMAHRCEDGVVYELKQ